MIGGSGYVGREICNHVGQKHSVISTYCTRKGNKNAIKYDLYFDDIRQKISNHQIEIVIFAAMVEKGEKEELKKAYTRFVHAFSDKRIVYLSSDGIFSGEKGQYNEDDIPDPKTAYGRNLLLCEDITRKYCPNHCIIRPSYLYGFSHGKLDRRLSETKRKLLGNRKVDVFCNMYKSPMGIQQFAGAVENLATTDFIGTIHVAGYRTSVLDFQRRGMAALGVPTSAIHPRTMPENGSFLKDTSLNISKWMSMAGTQPLSIEDTLTV